MMKITVNNKNIEAENNETLEDVVKKHFKEKNIVAANVDNTLKDLSDNLTENSNIELVTTNHKDGLDILRHSCAHVFGHAIKQIYPEVKMVIGPVIDNGFYYDILSNEPITEKDLKVIENRMRKLAKKNYPIKRQVVSKDQAISIFNERNEPYKVELLKEIKNNEIIAVYHHEEYIDMCRGPHLTNTKHIKAFKLMKISGSYWKGNSNNQSLTRIYGTAWPTLEEQESYLQSLEEAEKRDHRLLGKKLDLFHFQEESPGMVFWHDKGWTVFNLIKDFITSHLRKNNYQVINTPQILDKSLWKKSGHLDKFGDLIFDVGSEKKEFAIKPMSCPGHIQVFNQGLKSYKDLPLKYAEFGVVHRNEPSGTLHGLLRIRAFTQDDAHIFCTTDQIEREISLLINDIKTIYNKFGFNDLKIELSTRPEKRVGSEEIWDKAEDSLKKALDLNNIEFSINAGDGAFYGPKIDFSLKDSLSRVWQLGTIQLDFSMPGRLSASYIDADGTKDTPVMIHRAILGSLERFVGILIEHYSGNLPLWLAPTQITILNITDKHKEYSTSINNQLIQLGYRSECDLSNEKIGYKIRNHAMTRVPYMLIIGDKELEDKKVTVRDRTGNDLGSMSIDQFCEMLKNEIN
ncbi:MAG: threonine--tRNA ligase [Gammaproteobacteria bacterium]|nr:threonine--tRNA ligase [Gammaproteobacteria bacterium]MBL6819489.1 threonine--tRNA ligase [Gammaproteobacteria bacterium]MBL6898858.1 threonine--tRNA ligase [Gammaproteobacteria bacterium]